jgi:hypothetical protein
MKKVDGMSFTNRQRLLVADDDADTLTTYGVFFEVHGFDTRAAKDGAEALAEYRVWRPSVVRCPFWMVERWREKSDACTPSLHRCWWPSPRCHQHLKWPNPTRSGFDHHLVKPASLPIILTSIMSHQRVSEDNAS